ncbi:MAG: metallophosphoesterase [Candidatus Helarchaeota archaeon]
MGKLDNSDKKKAEEKSKKRVKPLIKILSLFFLINGVYFSILNLNQVGPWLDYPFTKAPYLSWNGNTQTSMVVTWETPLPCTTVLEYGRNTTYGTTLEDLTPTMLHVVNLTGLEPGATYHYRVYAKDFFSPYFILDRTFTTAPNGTQAFSFAVYGDTRPDMFGITAHQTLVNDILMLNPDFVINVGDIVMTSNRLDQYDRFFYEIQYLAGTRPYMVSMGNHEAWELGGNVVPYLYYFSFPNNDLWYSYNYSNAYFISLIVLDEDQIIAPNQLNWLEFELQKANSSPNIDWIFLSFHSPIIHSGGGVSRFLGLQLLPLFNKYNVDFVLEGHRHFYERLYVPNTHHIIEGGGGAELEGSLAKTPFTITAELTHCFSHFIIQNRTLFYQCIDVNGRIIDWMTLTK